MNWYGRPFLTTLMGGRGRYSPDARSRIRLKGLRNEVSSPFRVWDRATYNNASSCLYLYTPLLPARASLFVPVRQNMLRWPPCLLTCPWLSPISNTIKACANLSQTSTCSCGEHLSGNCENVAQNAATNRHTVQTIEITDEEDFC